MSADTPPEEADTPPGEGKRPTWLVVTIGVIAALVIGGVVGALIQGDEEEKASEAIALEDAEYSVLVQQLDSALREHAATASAVQSQEQAKQSQAALQRQEAQMQAVAADAAKQEQQQRAQANEQAADRSAALQRQAEAASSAAQQTRQAAENDSAAVAELQNYAQQLSGVSAELDSLLGQLGEAQDAAAFVAILVEIADELERLEAAAAGTTTSGATTTPDATTTSPDSTTGG